MIFKYKLGRIAAPDGQKIVLEFRLEMEPDQAEGMAEDILRSVRKAKTAGGLDVPVGIVLPPGAGSPPA